MRALNSSVGAIYRTGDTLRMPISLRVTAEPVARETTLVGDSSGGALLAVAGKATTFSFQARDFEGLPLRHASGKYTAVCGDGCSASVSHPLDHRWSACALAARRGRLSPLA